MTIKAYLDDANTLNFEGKITDVVTRQEAIWLVLDKTYFYPEGGGQPSDKGVAGEWIIDEVQSVNSLVLHRTTASPSDFDTSMAIGRSVICQIDPKRRRDLMCQHSAQHVLSAVLDGLYSTATVGFHLTEENLTIDTDTFLTPVQWQEIELIVNNWVREALPFTIHYPTDETIGNYNLRKQTKVVQDIRLISLGDRDVVPCGGTHLNHTGEIGLVKIEKVDKYKVGQRVYFSAAKRAVLAMQRESEAIKSIGAMLSTTVEQSPQAVAIQLEKQKQLAFDYQLLLQEKVANEARELVAKALNAQLLSKPSLISLWDDQRSPLEMKALIGALTADKNYSGPILVGYRDDKGAQFVFRAPLEIDASKLLSEAKSLFPLRGGGSSERIQAGAQEEAAVKNAYDWFCDQLNPLME